MHEQKDQYNKQEVNLASSDTEGIGGREICYMAYMLQTTLPRTGTRLNNVRPEHRLLAEKFPEMPFYPRSFLNQSACMCYHSL